MSNNPFEKQSPLPAAINQGAVAVEQERAIAEAQGQLILAKRFPRDEFAAHEKLMKSCSLYSLANVAFYNVPRAGGSVSGPSIRLAEEIARVYGNFEYGHKELSRDDKKSEVMVYAWDKENNNYSTRQITVFHVIDTRNGPKPCRDQKDIDDKIANVASKQMRGRILALLPKWMVEEAVLKCRETLSGNGFEPVENQVRRLLQQLAVYGVTNAMVKEYLNQEISEITSDQLVDLTGIYNSISDGGMKPSDFFGGKLEDKDPVKPQVKVLSKSTVKSVPESKEDKQEEAPDFGAPSVFDIMMQELPSCTAKELNAWKRNVAATFAEDSAEYAKLVEACKQHEQSIK
jgi:hypothetical protein